MSESRSDLSGSSSSSSPGCGGEMPGGRSIARVAPLATRLVVWGALFAVLYFLRSFFLLVFLTFVFSYIQANGVERLRFRIANRTVRVVLVGLCLLGVLIAIGAFIAPRVRQQAEVFADKFPTYMQTLDVKLVDLSNQYPVLTDLFPQLLEFQRHGSDTGAERVSKASLSSSILQELFAVGDNGPTGEQPSFKHTVDTIRNIGAGLLAAGSAFLLSLLFSFLIVLDMPKLADSVRNLRHTKVGFIYDEVSGSLRDFGQLLGRALEAQLFIAMLNSALTAIGIVLLGLGESAAFLSLIVFLCSFIPVAGVFISSVPICLLALEKSGFSLMLAAVLLITIVHMIEAYILNPKIYGHHLRMNPVVVLIILTIAGKMFHVWGLVLGVPVCNYIFGHAIRCEEDRVDT